MTSSSSVPGAGGPAASLIMACYNNISYLQAAVESALSQSIDDVEIIIVDDGSSDGSAELAQALAYGDRRVQAHRMPRNGGPAAARNRGLELARGRYVAILDSDDLLHPDRLRRLISVAETAGADIVADDLVIFDDDNRSLPEFFFRGRRAEQEEWVSLTDYLRESVLYGSTPNLGFLKPLIRRSLIVDHGIAYDEQLRIAEDDALIIRLLRVGARYRTIPEAGYFYRKHGHSISHRLSLPNVEAMVRAGDQLAAELATAPADVRAALARRNRAIRNARDFTLMIEALKGKRLADTASLMIRRPGALPLFRMPVSARLARFGGRRTAPPPMPQTARPKACFISNQRLIGATNGSSAYLVDLARATREAGFEPHLIQPSPALFGRLPFFRLRPEMSAFASHHVRGARRIGQWMIATDPRTYVAAAGGITRRLARRFGIRAGWTVDRPAPYAVALDWAKADQLFVTRHARPHADVIIADYMFQSRGFPFAMRPEAATAIVMHDLFHARSDGFSSTGNSDSVTVIGREAEVALLARGDAVIAIQQAEAAFVRNALPDREVILAPMAAQPVGAPQPGQDDRLLFVGSNTAPNIHGLRWFFDQVWPAIRAARPAASLDVAGSVASAFPEGGPAGVRFLGLVDDLAPLYADAAVVISPLIQGSGLKIKLIEALARGKAIVATGVTLQGVEEIASQAVARADDPIPFAQAAIRLLQAEGDRAALAARALNTARVHFSSEACYRSYRSWLARLTPEIPQVHSEEARLCA